MENQNKEITLENIKSILSDELKALSLTIDERIKVVEKTFDDKIKSVCDRVGKIEELPIAKIGTPYVSIPEYYAGRKLSLQGEKLREKIKATNLPLPILRDEIKFTEFCKNILDLAIAVIPPNVLSQSIDAQMRLKTAMTISTGEVGGYLVSPEYLWEIVQLAREKTWALNECTIVNMSQNTLYLPKEVTLPTVYWVAEGGTITATNPTFGQVELTAKKLAGLTDTISTELLQDSNFDLVSMLTEMFGYSIALEIDNQILNGTGSPVSGVLTAACGHSVVMGAGSTSFSAVTADVVRKMIRTLSAFDAANAKFVYSKDIQYYLDTLKDNNGRYIYREPSADRPAALWSRPVIEASNAPLESGSGASKGFIALGNWKKFYIGRRLVPTELMADPYTNFTTGLVRYRLISRWALNYAQPTAFCRAVTAAS